MKKRKTPVTIEQRQIIPWDVASTSQRNKSYFTQITEKTKGKVFIKLMFQILSFPSYLYVGFNPKVLEFIHSGRRQ